MFLMYFFLVYILCIIMSRMCQCVSLLSICCHALSSCYKFSIVIFVAFRIVFY